MINGAPFNSQIGKVLVEIGKALGKAVVAGIGLELARAASGHVKRVVGPKDDDDKKQTTTKAEKTTKKTTEKPADLAVEAIDPAEVARIRAENESLRRELEALKQQSNVER